MANDLMMRIGEVTLAYDEFGVRAAPLVLLIMGLGCQRVLWDDALCTRLAAAGFRVVRYDQRDIGQSTRAARFAEVDMPLRAIGKRMLGQAVRAPYKLGQLADDAAALIAGLGARSAHVVGASLGGMVAQHLALQHPTSVASLTLIMTTSGRRRYLPTPKALRALLVRKVDNASAAVATRIAAFRVIGSPKFQMDEARLAESIALAFARDNSAVGFVHQLAAVLASGDWSAALARVQLPALVIHGAADPLIPLAAGRHVASQLGNATWLPVAGMGHDFGHELWDMVVPAMLRHWRLADGGTGVAPNVATAAASAGQRSRGTI